MGMAAIPFILAATAYQAQESKFAREEAGQAAKEQGAKVEEAAQNVEKRRVEQEGAAAATATRDQARGRQRALAAGAQGPRSTILTGPLGLPAPAEVARKTLLGA